MGAEAPAENIIATMVVITWAYFAPLVLPFLVRFGRQTVARIFIVMLTMSFVSVAIFSMRNPFDAMHPKRLYVIHSENVSSAECD